MIAIRYVKLKLACHIFQPSDVSFCIMPHISHCKFCAFAEFLPSFQAMVKQCQYLPIEPPHMKKPSVSTIFSPSFHIQKKSIMKFSNSILGAILTACAIAQAPLMTDPTRAYEGCYIALPGHIFDCFKNQNVISPTTESGFAACN